MSRFCLLSVLVVAACDAGDSRGVELVFQDEARRAQHRVCDGQEFYGVEEFTHVFQVAGGTRVEVYMDSRVALQDASARIAVIGDVNQMIAGQAPIPDRIRLLFCPQYDGAGTMSGPDGTAHIVIPIRLRLSGPPGPAEGTFAVLAHEYGHVVMHHAAREQSSAWNTMWRRMAEYGAAGTRFSNAPADQAMQARAAFDVAAATLDNDPVLNNSESVEFFADALGVLALRDGTAMRNIQGSDLSVLGPELQPHMHLRDFTVSHDPAQTPTGIYEVSAPLRSFVWRAHSSHLASGADRRSEMVAPLLTTAIADVDARAGLGAAAPRRDSATYTSAMLESLHRHSVFSGIQ